MSEFTALSPKEWNGDPIARIGGEWMLIAAEREGRTNAMTASWGGLGVLWNRPVAFIFVRKSRYTKELIDAAEHFSLTFFDRPSYTEMLSYMGKVSGRDEDKLARAGLHALADQTAPYFAEANTALICRKLSRHPLSPDGFLDPEIVPKFYADGDYHELYIGEIETVLVRE